MILTLLIILFFLMVVVGGNRGVDSFFSLAKTMVAMLVNIYLIAWGLPAIPVTLLVSVFFVATVLYAQNGVNAKMHAAAIAVLIVVIIVMLGAGPLLYRAGISGYNEIEQYEEISMYLSGNIRVSMAAVSISAVVLGLLGAVMDTAVAITTAVNEVYVNNQSLTKAELVQSGLHVGKDILGTTVNTLFFAGLGESIMLAILFMRNAETIASIINSKSLLQEVAGLLIGGIGCLAIIPLSSVLVAGFVVKKK
ncbi:MAG: YibE/F family protein [Eubacteriales bacterium]|nr:YibE/F family protein [Eubacteriales bacterium]